jgi:hypothetical protein
VTSSVLANCCPFTASFSYGMRRQIQGIWRFSEVTTLCFVWYCRCVFVQKKPAYSNLCAEYCERIQLTFLLQLLSPEYSFIGHFAQHCAHSQCFCYLSKLTVAHSVHHCHSHGHHKNVDATRKSVFPLVTPYHMLLKASIMSLKEIYVAKHNISCSNIVL